MSPTCSRTDPPHRLRAHRRALSVALLLLAAEANAATPATLPGIVVTGERELQGTPASIDRVEVESVPARQLKSAAELLQRIPGVAARDRQNLAQDTQLTIRGFGARSAFGVRGLRIFQDGIPATMPDGQGQLSHIPLEALARVDVLRGPFSALYGNASGGVVEFSSADPPAQSAFGVHAATGSDGLVQANLWFAGPWRDDVADEGYRVDAGHLELAGFRQHSRARRDTRQARLLAGNAPGTRIALTADSLELTADDPQGLTFAQAVATPRAASAGALAFDTRKRVRQQQLGVHAEQALGARNTLWLNTWGGTRKTFQMLSIPVAAQQAPGSGGGVVDLDRHYAGADLRWRLDASLAQRPASLTVGVESQRSSEHRHGYENFIGDTLGVVGALRRDQQDTVRNRDLYAEARWDVLPRWSATLGVRRSRVDFSSRDAYIAPGNPDDSGALEYAQTTPVAGLAWRANDALEFYANAGRGFETPSFAELAYRADGGSGLNDGLRPAISRSAELGLRAHRGEQVFEVVVFDSRTQRRTRRRQQSRRTQHLHQRGRYASQRLGTLRLGPARRGVAIRSRVRAPGRALSRQLPDLPRAAVRDARHAHRGRQPDPGDGARFAVGRTSLDASARCRCVRAGQRGRACLRRRFEQRARAGLRHAGRGRRTSLAAGTDGVGRLRAHRQPARQARDRLGDRQRRQRTLLRARAGSRLERRPVASAGAPLIDSSPNAA